ncbi:hypothetical protein ACLI4U_15190 [Natrialbaceae archaeon A-CW2]
MKRRSLLAILGAGGVGFLAYQELQEDAPRTLNSTENPDRLSGTWEVDMQADLNGQELTYGTTDFGYGAVDISVDAENALVTHVSMEPHETEPADTIILQPSTETDPADVADLLRWAWSLADELELTDSEVSILLTGGSSGFDDYIGVVGVDPDVGEVIAVRGRDEATVRQLLE